MSTPPELNLWSRLYAVYKAGVELVNAVDQKLRFSWFFFGTRIKHNYRAKQSGIEASVVLLGLVITNTIGVGVRVHERGREAADVLALYVIATTVPLVAMRLLLGASKSRKKKAKPMHWFNPATVRFVRWNLAGSFLLVGATIVLVLTNKFPGQRIPETVFFDVQNPGEHDSVDFPNKRTLTFDVHIDREKYPEGIPEQLPFTFALTDAGLKESWEIVRVDGYRLVDGEEIEETPGPHFVDSETPYRKGGFWLGLEKDAEYLLRVFLLSLKEGDAAQTDYNTARELIMEGRGITVMDSSPL